jgi:hypothetical protein
MRLAYELLPLPDGGVSLLVMLKILNISEYLTFQTGGAGRFDFIKNGCAKAR